IYMSNDQGATWEEVYVFPQITRARRMKQHPSDADVLFALTDIGVYRTTDGGMWWDTVITGDFVDIEFHPTDHDTLYISGYADFRYSQDAGTTWDTTLLAGTDPLRAPNFCGGRIEIAVSPAAPDNVWLLAGPGMPPNQYCGLYVSASSADTFTLIDTGPFNVLGNPGSTSDQSTYDIAIAVSPNNGNTILAGGLVVWRTGNGAANWTVTAPYWETTGGQQSTLPTNYVHPDIHDLAYNLLDNKVYCASDGGIYVSVNGGFSWTNISQGIITSQIYHINGSLLSTGRLPIGLQDNGVKMRVSGTSGDFQHINSGDGYEVVTDPTNSDIVAATLNDTCFIYNTYSTTSRTGAPTGPGFFKPLRYKPGDGNTLYFGDPALTVYTISTNSTSTLNDGSSASWTIETCEDVAARIYFAGGANGFQNDPNGSFYTSFDSGASSFDRSGVAGFPSELQIITDIAVYPGQCHKVAFSMGGFFAGSKVYYSENSGATLWQNISYNLPNVPVFSLAIDADGSFYAGTEIGVFVKSETGTEWAPYYNGLPRVPISGLVVQQSVNKLIASTFGRGVWETFLASGCPVNSLVTNPLKGQWVQSADIQVTSTSTVTGGAGTDVRFTAGERVILMPGFQVATGNRFIADLDGCVE
ncbi:MAG: hypothetical protein R3301_16795, partial [Saprospiraceae bacterium]|nr:hypothetical protein [Saprospiraceae bacterium]